MIVTIKGRKYRLSPGLSAFLYGLLKGVGFALALFLLGSIFVGFFAGALMYAVHA